MNNEQQYFENQDEIDKLRLDNVQLKQNLEKEEFLHKSLYRQWSELHNMMLAKEREVERLKSRSIFYKYGFYLILFLIIPGYYFLNKNKIDEKLYAPVVSIPSQPVITAPKQTTNDSLLTKQDTILLPAVQQPSLVLEKPKAIQPDTISTQVVTINKPVMGVPLSDASRDSIYWIGWNAYYGNLSNPFKGSPQKNKIWLQGWKAGETDAKKQLAKDSVAAKN